MRAKKLRDRHVLYSLKGCRSDVWLSMRRAGANEQRRLKLAQPGWLAIECAETGLSSQSLHYSSLDQAESLLSAAL